MAHGATNAMISIREVTKAFGPVKAVNHVSFDIAQLPVRETDRIAELAEAGLGLLVGALPTASAIRLPGGPPTDPRQTAETVAAMWRRTALPAAQADSCRTHSP